MFAADLRVRGRRITVAATDRVQIGERAAQVEQKLAYTIEFEAVDHLLVDVPKSLAENPSLEFQRGGKPLVVKSIAPGEASAAPAGMVQLRIALPEACLGRCDILVRYGLPLPALQAVQPAIEVIPLPVAAEGETTGNTLLLSSAAGIRACAADRFLAAGGARAGSRRPANAAEFSGERAH